MFRGAYSLLKYINVNKKATTLNQLKNIRNVEHLRFAHTKPIKCWNCGLERQRITELFCEQCHIIQNPTETENYFNIFSLEEKFDLDPKVLQNKYRAMQNVLHPDKFSQKSQEEKVISEEFSSLVNRAYNILSSPLKRASHLLQLKGENILEGEKMESPEFLMEIMELNEEVEDANTEEKIRNLHKKHISLINEVTLELRRNFEGNDLGKAKENLIKMKYYNSVGAHLSNLMRERGIVD